MSNTVAGRLQFDNSQECIAEKRQWRRHANENTLERNASIMRAIIVILKIFLDIYMLMRACAHISGVHTY